MSLWTKQNLSKLWLGYCVWKNHRNSNSNRIIISWYFYGIILVPLHVANAQTLKHTNLIFVRLLLLFFCSERWIQRDVYTRERCCAYSYSKKSTSVLIAEESRLWKKEQQQQQQKLLNSTQRMNKNNVFSKLNGIE